MQPHNSSFVRGVGYDWDTATMTIRLGGRVYEYYDVPEDVYQHVLQADSLGRAYNQHVKGFYNCSEVRRP